MPYAANQFQPVYPGGYKSTNPPGTDIYQGDTPNSHLLRFYLPPATSGTVSLAMFCPQKDTVGVVARLGAPPQCSCEAYKTAGVSDDYYLGLPWDKTPGTLALLRSRDWRVRNGSGTIGIVKDNNGASKGEWLFIQVLYRGNRPNLGGCSFMCKVDATKYAKWFSASVFDASGNPHLVVYDLPMGSCDFTSTGENTAPTDSPAQPLPDGNPFEDMFPKPKPVNEPIEPPTPDPVEPKQEPEPPVDPVEPPEPPVVDDPVPEPTPMPEIDPASGWPIVMEMEVPRGGLLYFGSPFNGWKGFAIRVK